MRDRLYVFNKFVAHYGRLPTEVDPDYLEMLRMSKYRVMDVPDFSPGNCANCGASKNDGRKYIDFGLQVDWYGTVYLCGLCLQDITNAMGFFELLNERIKNLLAEVESLKEAQRKEVDLPERLAQAWEEFKEYYARVYLVRDDPIPDPVVVLEPDSPTVESGASETKQRTTKSTSSSRSTNVPSLASLLDINQTPGR